MDGISRRYFYEELFIAFCFEAILMKRHETHSWEFNLAGSARN